MLTRVLAGILFLFQFLCLLPNSFFFCLNYHHLQPDLSTNPTINHLKTFLQSSVAQPFNLLKNLLLEEELGLKSEGFG